MEEIIYNVIFLAKFVNRGKYQEQRIIFRGTRAKLSKLEQQEALAEAHETFIKEYLLDKENKITDFIGIEFVKLERDSLDQYLYGDLDKLYDIEWGLNDSRKYTRFFYCKRIW